MSRIVQPLKASDLQFKHLHRTARIGRRVVANITAIAFDTNLGVPIIDVWDGGDSDPLRVKPTDAVRFLDEGR